MSFKQLDGKGRTQGRGGVQIFRREHFDDSITVIISAYNYYIYITMYCNYITCSCMVEVKKYIFLIVNRMKFL